MRKFVAVLLIALMAVSGLAVAESVDFAAMTTDELLTLRAQLDAEIAARTGESDDLISDGVFVVGTDIKAGMYRITCTAAFDDREFYVTIFSGGEDYQKATKDRWSVYYFSQAVLLPGMETVIKLTDGMVVEIYNGQGIVEVVQPSWAM